MSIPKNAPTAHLLYECGPNWRYAVGEAISDPALWYRSPKGVSHAIVNDLEYDHLNGHCTVQKLHRFAEVKKALKGQPLTLANMVAWLMGLEKTPPVRILVPRDFASGLFVALKKAKLPLVVAEGELFFAERAIKSADEIKALRAAQALNEQLIAHARSILVEAEIGKANTLFWHDKVLTSEIVRGEMNALAARLGATEFGNGPIVACGKQGATPHHRGSGPLKAHELIVIDSFPRHANGYWGDCTRTYLKGTPKKWQTELVEAVLAAQKLALDLIMAGNNGKEIHATVQQFFAHHGFATGSDAQGRPYGFFHGTGHGVGLELHDPGPRTIAGVDCILKAGMVTSVEPGLYLPNKGGCRIEDVVMVTEEGHKNLTKLSKADWVIDA